MDLILRKIHLKNVITDLKRKIELAREELALLDKQMANNWK